MLRTLLAAAIVAAIAAPASAQSFYLQVIDWPVSQFFDRVGLLKQAELLVPLSETFEVKNYELHACLMVINGDATDRNMIMQQAVDECLAELKGWKR